MAIKNEPQNLVHKRNRGVIGGFLAIRTSCATQKTHFPEESALDRTCRLENIFSITSTIFGEASVSR